MNITPDKVKERCVGTVGIVGFIQTPSDESFTLAIHWVCFYMIKKNLDRP